MHTVTPTILSESFFARPVLTVAPELLGKTLISMLSGEKMEAVINEVEAYDGPDDAACHGRFGRTKRTAPMFGPAGHWYVYLCYGCHFLLNIVTCEEEYPAAVLIRGAGEWSGPGKLTKGLGITGKLSGTRASKQAGLWIEDPEMKIRTNQVKRTPRIGIDYAGAWAKKPYRFVLDE